eukprot:gene12151-25500_t
MGQLRDYFSKYSAFVIVLLGTLLNLIPFFSGQSNNTDAEYLYSLNDMEAQSSLFITVGATLPVFYDLTIDCIYYVRTSSENIQWASRIGVHYFTLHTIAILVSMTAGLTVLEEDLLRGTQLADLNETILDIKGCCDIAVDTLSDMLTYDKVESCKMELEKSNLNVDKFFTDCLRPFNMQARAKVITLKSAIMCSTRVYRRLHMIGDEIKISVEKGAESVNKSDANKSYFLKVEVIDSGAGISE